MVIQRKVRNRAEEGITLNNLGWVYYKLSQYPKALVYHRQVLAITREVHSREGEEWTLDYLGTAYLALRQHTKAVKYEAQALAIAREVNDRVGEGWILNDLGEVDAALGRYPKAVEYYEQALVIVREVHDRAREGTILSNLMRGWQARGKPRLAIFYGKQAVNMFQAIRGMNQRLEKTLQRSFLKSREAVYRNVVDLLIAAGRLPEAQQVLTLLKEEEFFDFVRREASEAPTVQGRATLTPEETVWADRYQQIADRVTAFGTERGALLAKQARTQDEERRLALLENDLTIAQCR